MGIIYQPDKGPSITYAYENKAHWNWGKGKNSPDLNVLSSVMLIHRQEKLSPQT